MGTLNAPRISTTSPSGNFCPHGMWHPTVKILEYVEISTDLSKRLTSRPNHIAVFANITESSSLQSSGKPTLNAELPIQFDGGNDGFNDPNRVPWDTIVGELLKIKSTCESGKKYMQ